MVCIAAFVVLLVISVPVLVLTIIGRFNDKVKNFTLPFWKLFKKAWHCVGRRVTFRACDSSFKDDIKNSVLSRLIFKHNKWVKPVSTAIEVGAVLIVIVAIWSLVEVAKSGLSLYVFGTCNVAQPQACILGQGDVCSTDESTDGNPIARWFTEWGDLFTALPARMKTWDASEYKSDEATFFKYTPGNPVAADIFDPGCINCLRSFNNQLNSGFFDKYNVFLIPYPIRSTEQESGFRFTNSYLVASYIVAARAFKTESIPAPDWLIVQRLYTGSDEELGVDYQSAFNGQKGLTGTPYSEEKAENVLRAWLKDFGFDGATVAAIVAKAHSDEVKNKLEEYRALVDDTIRTKGIPTTIFDGRRHIGVYQP